MDDDLHFSRYRAEHARRLDADYRAWLEQRRSAGQRDTEPSAARTDESRDDSRDESALESLGRAVSETVTGTLPDGGRGTGKAR